MLKWTIALMLAASACLANAQASEADSTKAAHPKTFYQMIFVIKELDGERVVNAHTYSTTVCTNGPQSSIRAGERVPWATGDATNPIWQTVEIGVDIDLRDIELAGDRLSFRVTVAINGVMPREEKNIRLPPVIRNNRWDALVIIPLKRPTVIFSSDDPFSTQKVQLQVTASPVHE